MGHFPFPLATSTFWLQLIMCQNGVVPTRTNKHKVVVKFLKENVISRFGPPPCDNKWQRVALLQQSFWSPNAKVLHNT